MLCVIWHPPLSPTTVAFWEFSLFLNLPQDKLTLFPNSHLPNLRLQQCILGSRKLKTKQSKTLLVSKKKKKIQSIPVTCRYLQL